MVIIELHGVDEMKYKVMTRSIKLPLEAPLDMVTLCYELFEAILNLCSSGCQAAKGKRYENYVHMLSQEQQHVRGRHA